jgi:hypothetical protein
MTQSDPRRDAAATRSNREPILEVLARVLPAPALVLEIASGTGQHGAFFASRLPHLEWQSSERDPEAFASIEAWAEEARDGCGARVRAPLRIDVRVGRWPIDRCDAVFNANMIHISPWQVCLGLLAGASRVLPEEGPLVLYGPYRVGGEHTAESNAAFDAWLRGRDPDWGVRDLEHVERAARAQGLGLDERVPMPANNQILVFRKRS